MVLGTTREQPNVADYLIDEAPPLCTWEEWQNERGPLRWEGGADLAGGFPGFAARGGRLDGVQLRLTDRYLLADEGRQHGFGLPLDWLIGADLVPSSRAERPDPTLRVRYSDGAHERTFQARFRGSLLSPRGRRAEQALAALAALGVLRAGEALPAEPELGLSWEAAARFEGENVIWSGRASVALGAAADRAACDVWLTTRSIIWGSSAGEGILRLPLPAILDVIPADLADRVRTPAVFVATADAFGGRHEYPFVFDRHSPAQRNLRERGAFLVGLRSRGLALGSPAPLVQPWRSAIVPAAPEPIEAPAASSATGQRPAPSGRFRPRPLNGTAAEPLATGRWERRMAEWTGHPAWPDAPSAEPAPPDEATVRERLAAILGAATDAPAADVPLPGAERGVIVPWPGAERVGRRRGMAPSSTVRGARASAGDVAPESLEPPANQTSPETRSTVEAGAGDATVREIVPPGDEFEPTDALFAGSWPIPAGFLGEVVAEHFAARSLEASAAVEAAAVAGGNGASEEDPIAEPPLGALPSIGSTDHRAALRAYEESLLRAITGTIRAIEDRLEGGMAGHPATQLPTPSERSAALAALDSLMAAGELPATEAEVHRALLLAAGEAGPRLRSLLELRDAGYLPDGELDRKRRAIVAPLAALLTR